MTILGLLSLFAPYGGAGYVAASDFWEALRRHVLAEVPALTGGFYVDRAGRRAAMPFAVAEDGAGASIEHMTESPTIRNGSASASFYATSKSASKALGRQFKDAIKDAPLRFEEGRLMYLRASQIYGGLLDPSPGPGGGKVYRTLVLFDYVYSTSA